MSYHVMSCQGKGGYGYLSIERAPSMNSTSPVEGIQRYEDRK